MAQSGCIYPYFLSIFTEDEIEVARTLLEVPHLVKFYWGAKRRRSVLLPLLPSPSPPATISSPCGTGVVAPSLNREKPPVEVKASSPVTPLSFLSSESDDLKCLKRKVSAKKKREELLEIVEERSQRNKSLKKEIEEMKHCKEKLKEQNLILKSRRQQLSSGIERERREPDLEVSERLNDDMKLEQPTFKSSIIINNQDYHHHQLPWMVYRTAMKAETSENYLHPDGQIVSLITSSSGLETINEDVGPRGLLPDLNLPAAESLWIDSTYLVDNESQITRAEAAQGRHRRMLMCMKKKTIGTSRLHHSR